MHLHSSAAPLGRHRLTNWRWRALRRRLRRLRFGGATDAWKLAHSHAHSHPGLCDTTRLAGKVFESLACPQTRLRSWVESISFTSVETLPTYLGIGNRKSALAPLRPLPYTRQQHDMLGDEWKDYIARASAQWLPDEIIPAQPEASLPGCLPPAPEDAPALVTWSGQNMRFDAAIPAGSWHAQLLDDFRTSALHCGLLHECRPATWHTGFLSKLSFCRLGFWHCWAVPGEEHTWMRCHGLPLPKISKIVC